jgi:hypothetical protein
MVHNSWRALRWPCVQFGQNAVDGGNAALEMSDFLFQGRKGKLLLLHCLVRNDFAVAGVEVEHLSNRSIEMKAGNAGHESIVESPSEDGEKLDEPLPVSRIFEIDQVVDLGDGLIGIGESKSEYGSWKLSP